MTRDDWPLIEMKLSQEQQTVIDDSIQKFAIMLTTTRAQRKTAHEVDYTEVEDTDVWEESLNPRKADPDWKDKRPYGSHYDKKQAKLIKQAEKREARLLKQAAKEAKRTGVTAVESEQEVKDRELLNKPVRELTMEELTKVRAIRDRETSIHKKTKAGLAFEPPNAHELIDHNKETPRLERIKDEIKNSADFLGGRNLSIRWHQDQGQALAEARKQQIINKPVGIKSTDTWKSKVESLVCKIYLLVCKIYLLV
jgi:hypothetical protein